MGKVILVSDVLTEQMILAGESVIDRLDSSPVTVDDVFWYRRSEDVDWKLVLTMPGLSFYGPLVGYEDMQNILFSIPDNVPAPDLDQIVLLDTNAPAALALRHSLKEPFQRSRYALNKVWLDRVYFEGFYVYRLAETVSITCDLVLDQEIRSSLRGRRLRGGSAYVFAEGFSSVVRPGIIAHGHIEAEEPAGIRIEMPVKYGIRSSAGIQCKATITAAHEGWEEPPSVSIIAVKLTPVS